MKLKKFIEEISPWASVLSLGLAVYWHFYPSTLRVFSTQGVPLSIETSSLVLPLFIIGILLMIDKVKIGK